MVLAEQPAWFPGLRVGLTGGIGSGKSTVAQSLVACGAVLVDTDAIARQLTLAGGAALPELTAQFGHGVMAPDGALDRAQMRALVFSDPAVRARLEAILHPLIGHEAQRQAAEAGARTVVFDVPLLAESGHWQARVHRVLVVDCSEATQLARVAQRPGWSATLAQQVVQQQATRPKRRGVADAVIHNDGLTLDELHQQVQALWRRWAAVEQSRRLQSSSKPVSSPPSM